MNQKNVSDGIEYIMDWLRSKDEREREEWIRRGIRDTVPKMVPWTTVPFFNSIVTVSLASRDKNLTSFISCCFVLVC
jgi:hypothetical protein